MSPPAPPELSIAEFKRQLEGAKTGVDRFKVVDLAVYSRNLEYIRLCLEDGDEKAFYLVSITRKLPDSQFRDEVVILILRSNTCAWPPQRGLPSRGDNGFGLDEPVVSVVKKYRPDITLSRDTLGTREKRLALSDEIERGMRSYPKRGR